MLENVADIVNQKCLHMLGKGQDHNIFHSDNLLVELIVLLAGIDSFKIMHMVIPGRCSACSKRKSDH